MKKRRFECPICGQGVTEGAVRFSVTPTCTRGGKHKRRVMKEVKEVKK